MKHPGGRPTIMTPDTVQKLEYAFALGCSDEEACFYANIVKQTLYSYQKKHPEFVDRKEALKTRPIFLARETLVKGIQNDPDLALKMLERKRKNEFSTRAETDITSDGNPLAPILVKFIGGDSGTEND